MTWIPNENFVHSQHLHLILPAGVLYFPQNDGHPLQREITNLAPPQIQNFVKLIKTTLENMTNNR